jgi:hypothetical protein
MRGVRILASFRCWIATPIFYVTIGMLRMTPIGISLIALPTLVLAAKRL